MEFSELKEEVFNAIEIDCDKMEELVERLMNEKGLAAIEAASMISAIAYRKILESMSFVLFRVLW